MGDERLWGARRALHLAFMVAVMLAVCAGFERLLHLGDGGALTPTFVPPQRG